MKIMRYIPGNAVLSTTGDVDRLFDSLLGDLWSVDEAAGPQPPRADVGESDEGFSIRVDLPGHRREDIQVSVFGETLTVRGERKSAGSDEDARWHRLERYRGTLERTFNLRVALDAGNVKAVYKDGVLDITVPKAESAKPRMIDVKVVN